MLDKSRVTMCVVGHVMVLYSPDWIKIAFSFIPLAENLFQYSTLIEHGLYTSCVRDVTMWIILSTLVL